MDIFSPLYKKEKHILDKAEGLLAKARSHDGEKALDLFYKLLGLMKNKRGIFVQYKTSFAMIYIQTGWELLHRGQFTDGLNCFNAALNLDTNNPSLWNEKGLAHASLKQPEEALRSHEQAIALNRMDSTSWVNKGDALKALGRPDEAIRSYEEALKLDKDNTGVHERILELRPMDAMVHSRQGSALARSGRFEEAVECFDRAIAIEPKNASILAEKGLALNSLGRFGEAIQCLDKAVDLRPENNEFWVTRGLIFDNNDRFEEALTCYDLVLKRDGKNKHAWNLRGLLLSKQGRYDEAVENFNMAISLDENDKYMWNNKGMTLFEDSRWEDSLKCFKKALEIDPVYKDGLIGSGLVHLAREEYQEAKGTFERCLEIDTSDARTWGHLGDAQMGMGRYESAVEAFDEALALSAHSVDLMKRKANALAKLGDYRSAMECLDRIIDVGKEDKGVWKTRGDMLFKMEAFDQAIESYEKALSCDPEFVEASDARRRAEESLALSQLEGYAREILSFEDARGRRPNKEEAFKDCRVPFEHLDKVLEFLDEEEDIEPECLSKNERNYLEAMSLLVIRECTEGDLKDLKLCTVVRTFPELSVLKSKSIIDYIRTQAKAKIEIERTLSPMLEAKVRSTLVLPEEQRDLVSVALHLNVGVHEAGKILMVLKALKGEKVCIKGESRPTTLDLEPVDPVEGTEAEPKARSAKAKPKARSAKPEPKARGPKKRAAPKSPRKRPKGKKKFSTMSLREQMMELGIDPDADIVEPGVGTVVGGQVEEAIAEEEESGSPDDVVVPLEGNDVFIPTDRGTLKEVEPLIPTTPDTPGPKKAATKKKGRKRKSSRSKKGKKEVEEDVVKTPTDEGVLGVRWEGRSKAKKKVGPKVEEPEEDGEEEPEEDGAEKPEEDGEEKPEEDGEEEPEEDGEEEDLEEDEEGLNEQDRLREARIKEIMKKRGGFRDTL